MFRYVHKVGCGPWRLWGLSLLAWMWMGQVSIGQTISTVAGGGLLDRGDGGPATEASLSGPSGVFLDRSGILFIANTADNRVRRVDGRGIITTVAGGGNPGAEASGVDARIGDGGLVSAVAIVDLDVIRQQRSRGWLDPLQYLAGRLRVTASGTIRSGGGVAQIDIQAVTVAGIPVPVQVLHELVRHFTRTVDHPDGTRLDEPIPLPYRITELQLSPGQAVIVQ